MMINIDIIKMVWRGIPLWIKTSIIVSVFGMVVHYVDGICNDEKRSLKKENSSLFKIIQTKNDTIDKLRQQVSNINRESINDLLRAKIECKKAQRRRYEDPIIDINNTLWF